MAAPDRSKPVLVPASAAAAPLLDWLLQQALPRWSTTGIDSRAGGFFEKIDLTGRPIEEPRRARVVARQIYVFATAARRGWLPSADACVEHGLTFLRNRMRTADGTFAAAIQPDGSIVRGEFDLYEHAFVLFALAAASRDRPDREALGDEALALLSRMRLSWAHPTAGFEESAPRTLPLKSNPHMHLLEAALAWAAQSSGTAKSTWGSLADELADLCLSRFIGTDSGAVREYFDGDWAPMPGPQGRSIEPGHQFEWAWLLMCWAGQAADDDKRMRALAAARQLLQIGEDHGVDLALGVAVNELRDDWQVIDGRAKLWPQTERIKAWHAAAAAAIDPAQAASARLSLSAAVNGLMRYLRPVPSGLWNEQMDADGTFPEQDCRASSLYHIVCAIDVLQGDRAVPPPA